MCPRPPPLPPPLLSGLSLRALCCCSCVLLGPDGVSHLSVNQETHRQTRSTGNVYVAAAFPSIAWRNSTIHHETMPAFSHRSAASPLMESDGPSRCTAATNGHLRSWSCHGITAPGARDSTVARRYRARAPLRQAASPPCGLLATITLQRFCSTPSSSHRMERSQWRCWGRSCVVVRPPLKTRSSTI